MLVITTPFWDGFIIGCLSLAFVIYMLWRLVIDGIYNDADPRRAPEDTPQSISQYMDDWEAKAYHS